MFEKVKRMYNRDKKSLREIAKSTGLSRNTVVSKRQSHLPESRNF